MSNHQTRAKLDLLVERATEEPTKFKTLLKALGNRERLSLLDRVAAGNASRRLSKAFTRLKPPKTTTLGIKKGIKVYLAKTSFPMLGSFELHIFRGRDRKLWGRTVTLAPTFIGPGYFGVTQTKEGLTIDFDRTPPAKTGVPQGWPPVIRNSTGLAGMTFGGTQFKLRGSGDGILTGSVWRNDRDMGVFVNLVRAK